MNSAFDLQLDNVKLEADAAKILEAQISLGNRAIRDAAVATRDRLRLATRTAAGGRLDRAWGSSFYENNRTNAAGNVYARGGPRSKGALTYWSTAGSARGRQGQYLAIPLPAAGRAKRGNADFQLTPREWEARTGIKLRPVFRRGKLPLLVADEARLSGSRGLARASRSKRQGPYQRGSTTVPIFVLVPQTRFQNAINVEGIVDQGRRELASAFR